MTGSVFYTVFTAALWIVIILIAAASAVAAQRPISMPTAAGSQQSIDDIREDYRLHAGPFYVEPAILLKELGVDTNVFNQAGDTNADFTMIVAPQAAVAVPFAQPRAGEVAARHRPRLLRAVHQRTIRRSPGRRPC